MKIRVTLIAAAITSAVLSGGLYADSDRDFQEHKGHILKTWEKMSQKTLDDWHKVRANTQRFFVARSSGSRVVIDYAYGSVHALAEGGDGDEAALNAQTKLVETLEKTGDWKELDAFDRQIGSLADARSFISSQQPRLDSTPEGTVAELNLAMIPDHLQQRHQRYARYIDHYAKQYEVDPDLVAAVIEVESYYNPNAQSPVGAIGLMQLMPDSGGREAVRIVTGVDRKPTIRELKTPGLNIQLGTAYLKYLLDYYSYVEDGTARMMLALAAYNWGMGNVDGNLRPAPDIVEKDINYRIAAAPRETREYVTKVRSKYGLYNLL